MNELTEQQQWRRDMGLVQQRSMDGIPVERKIVWLCLACHDAFDEKPACHPDKAVRVYDDSIRRGLNGVFALIVTDEEEPSNE